MCFAHIENYAQIQVLVRESLYLPVYGLTVCPTKTAPVTGAVTYSLFCCAAFLSAFLRNSFLIHTPLNTHAKISAKKKSIRPKGNIATIVKKNGALM